VDDRTMFSAENCSIARTLQVVGERWSLLILREAFYGTHRFDDFQHFLGVAPNILSARLKKLVQAGVMKRVRQKEHRGRFDYVLTEKGRDFFPAYLALKKWGDTWLAEPAGPQVVFRDRLTGAPIEVPPLLSRRGTPLSFEDTDVVAGTGAVPFNRKRFGR